MKAPRASIALLVIAAQLSVRSTHVDAQATDTAVPHEKAAAVETATVGFDDFGNVNIDSQSRKAKDSKEPLQDAEKGLYDKEYYDDDDDDDDDFDVDEVGDEVEGDYAYFEDNDNDAYDEIPCSDEHELCDFWASKGECDNNPNYMLKGCAKSCNSCSPSNASRSNSEKIVGGGYAEKYGEPQHINVPDDIKAELLQNLKKMEAYMAEVATNPEYDDVRAECKNREHRCLYWAWQGECKANAKYMQLHCAPVCHSCDLLDYDKRCPKEPNAPNALQPGDLNKLFERIVAEQEKVTILSRPDYPEREDETNTTYGIGPWVITIDDFISPEETERLIELGSNQGYERSTDVGKKKFDGTYEAKQSKSRTSTNAWCSDDRCYKDPLAQSATAKIEKLTGIPETNYEYLQLLKYHIGQYYRAHHDYIEHDTYRPYGPRILTAFLYLTDVEEGGGTNFPTLDLTVLPKRGRMLLWPSVLDEDPKSIDIRTRHQALDVEKGTKFAANAWIHLRNFKAAHEKGCT